MAAILYPPSRFQAVLRRCTWLGLLGIIVFVAILAVEIDFPGRGWCLMIVLIPGVVWLPLWAIVALRIR